MRLAAIDLVKHRHPTVEHAFSRMKNVIKRSIRAHLGLDVIRHRLRPGERHLAGERHMNRGYRGSTADPASDAGGRRYGKLLFSGKRQVEA